MNIWALPGPAGFVRRVERSLRNGASAVVRFPGSGQTGFRDRMLGLLNDSWTCSVFRPEPAQRPFESLCDRFAPGLSTGWGTGLIDLCGREDFQGRLIWIDGLERLDLDDWLAWRRFFADYAQASRSVREFERTLFVASLEGVPPVEPPEADVTLAMHDWRGVIDEMDLLFLAYERLGVRNVNPAMRSLLATTVARVAAWDLTTAERLLDEKDDVILAPIHMLQSLAREKGWTAETPVGWEFGTESGNGALHAALASLPDPPREIRRRVWSAQSSVLLPLIDTQRCKIVTENHGVIAAHLRSTGGKADPLDLEVGDLVSPALRRHFDRNLRERVERLARWRNALAHLKPLPLNAVRALAGS